MNTFKTPKGTELPIMDIRGKPYLQVAHRLVWMREEHPLWSIETTPVELTQTSTYFKATIRDEQGRILATAHKFEDKAGFSDHREKAETSAVGRALGMVGYGTQFCADELDEGERLADSPNYRITQHAPGPAIHTPPIQVKPVVKDPNSDLESRMEFIRNEAKKHNWLQSSVSEYIRAAFGVGLTRELTKDQMGELIATIRKRSHSEAMAAIQDGVLNFGGTGIGAP